MKTGLLIAAALMLLLAALAAAHFIPAKHKAAAKKNADKLREKILPAGSTKSIGSLFQANASDYSEAERPDDNPTLPPGGFSKPHQTGGNGWFVAELIDERQNKPVYHAITKLPCRIGSRNVCDLRINDAYVAPVHLTLEWDREQQFVEAVNGAVKNVVKLCGGDTENGQPIDRYALRGVDTVTFELYTCLRIRITPAETYLNHLKKAKPTLRFHVEQTEGQPPPHGIVAKMQRLIGDGSPTRATVISKDSGWHLFGRDESMNTVFPNNVTDIGRIHAKIGWLHGEGFCIINLARYSGATRWADGGEVKKDAAQRLAPGDRILLGSGTYTICIDEILPLELPESALEPPITTETKMYG